MAADKFLEVLQEYWGYSSFRSIQRDIIESISSGKDTLGLMPTGGGKSITFQVPALAMEGVCIVVTPLIALMDDQVAHLRKHNVVAAAIHAGMSYDEILQKLDACIYGQTKFLYVSPERLDSNLFQTKLKRMEVSFITVDEAHCISQWGYDFRPSYLAIAQIREILQKEAGSSARVIPVLALTATATPQVIDDIQKRLHFREKNVFSMSFERKNLAYVVRKTEDKYSELTHILQAIQGSSIVYVRSRKRTKEIAEYLVKNGISAINYHAGLDYVEKESRQRNWQKDEIRVMVATNAFGMGIDKPDVRSVIHFDPTDSLEAYFQEAGRSGRDGNRAYAVMLYNKSDQKKLEKRIIDTFPSKEYIKKVYLDIAYYYELAAGAGNGSTHEFDIDKFCLLFKHFPVQVDAALKILQRAGYLKYDLESDHKARVKFLLERDQLYRLNELNDQEETVITALLRSYGGLFVDYTYIDEALIAHKAGLNNQQTYLTLKALSKQRILDFIPRKNLPYITYTTQREEEENIFITEDVYEKRKEQFAKHVRGVVSYAINEDVCRSRQLLRYFGETESKDCGQCDVCIRKRKQETPQERLKGAMKIILDMLQDGEKHHVCELKDMRLPRELVEEALEQLASEEMIDVKGCFVYSKK